jgi:hypothetical protein
MTEKKYVCDQSIIVLCTEYDGTSIVGSWSKLTVRLITETRFHHQPRSILRTANTGHGHCGKNSTPIC